MINGDFDVVFMRPRPATAINRATNSAMLPVILTRLNKFLQLGNERRLIRFILVIRSTRPNKFDCLSVVRVRSQGRRPMPG